MFLLEDRCHFWQYNTESIRRILLLFPTHDRFYDFFSRLELIVELGMVKQWINTPSSMNHSFMCVVWLPFTEEGYARVDFKTRQPQILADWGTDYRGWRYLHELWRGPKCIELLRLFKETEILLGIVVKYELQRSELSSYHEYVLCYINRKSGWGCDLPGGTVNN